MVRRLIVIGYLVIIFILCILGISYLKNSTNEIIGMLDTSISYVENNMDEQAIEICDEISRKWTFHKKLLSAYLRDDYLSDIESLTSSLSILIRIGSTQDFYHQAKRIEFMINDLYNSELLNFENIF